jgi:hypothetical protein
LSKMTRCNADEQAAHEAAGALFNESTHVKSPSGWV